MRIDDTTNTSSSASAMRDNTCPLHGTVFEPSIAASPAPAVAATVNDSFHSLSQYWTGKVQACCVRATQQLRTGVEQTSPTKCSVEHQMNFHPGRSFRIESLGTMRRQKSYNVGVSMFSFFAIKLVFCRGAY